MGRALSVPPCIAHAGIRGRSPYGARLRRSCVETVAQQVHEGALSMPTAVDWDLREVWPQGHDGSGA